MLAEQLLENEGRALTRKAIDMALAGDVTALRLCIDRLIPPRRDRPVRFQLPPVKTADDASAALSAITAAVADGELTPNEASELAALVNATVHAIEVTELEHRVRVLEEKP